jgi:hypothetical protein
MRHYKNKTVFEVLRALTKTVWNLGASVEKAAKNSPHSTEVTLLLLAN